MDRIDIVCEWCEHDHILVKAYRKALHISQRELAVRTLTSQCYISQLERCKIKKEGEQERIVYNTRCDLREVCYPLDRFDETLVLVNVLIEYLKLSRHKYPISARKIARLISRFGTELAVGGEVK